MNGVSRRQASLPEVVRAVLFRPEEMLLLVGAPSERRRFLDAILAQRSRGVAQDLADLARVLAQRNALLRAIRAEEADETGLAAWDEHLAVTGGRVLAARLDLVAALGLRIGPLHDAVAPDDELGQEVGLAYVDTLKDAWPGRADAVTDPEARDPGLLATALRRRLAEVRQKEIWNGMSLVGPQRDDLAVTLGGVPVAAHASRGQQRTIIVALKLAETDLLADVRRPVAHRAARRRVQRAGPRALRAGPGPAPAAGPGAGHDHRPGARSPPATATGSPSGPWATASWPAPRAWPRQPDGHAREHRGGQSAPSSAPCSSASGRGLPSSWRWPRHAWHGRKWSPTSAWPRPGCGAGW